MNGVEHTPEGYRVYRGGRVVARAEVFRPGPPLRTAPKIAAATESHRLIGSEVEKRLNIRLKKLSDTH